MCGIVGVFDTRGHRPIDGRLLQAMCDRLSHRGPDGDGLHLSPGVGLGHRRLAIIDLSGGRQPLYNADETVVITFNGEIYNYQSLMQELEAAGYRFRTRSDTEVIVHAWEHWGEACVERLRGMFAFAIWDERRQTLFLARDRMGEKPLYWTLLGDGRLLFASELKAILADPSVQRGIDPRAVEDFFAYGYVPDPKTIYRGIHKLPPAHSLTLVRGRPVGDPKPYWEIDYGAPALGVGLDAAAEALRERLREAVRLQMVADVPLGAFLSGGVDSSAVVATMAGLSEDPIRTFSIGFGEARYDERRYAEQVAQRFATCHIERVVSPDGFDGIDELAGIYDEPFGDPSALPTLAVSRLARERVTVALSGDAGDELLAGYRRYGFHVAEERARQLLPAGLRRPVFGTLARLYPKLDWAPRPLRAKSTFMELAMGPVEGYFKNVAVLHDGLRDRLFTMRMRTELQDYRAIDVLRGHLAAAKTDDPLAAVQYADLKTFLAGGILTKVDRAAMAASLEVRVPMLDPGFVEWSARLPRRLKLQRGIGKRVLKRAFESQLGHDILYRPKQGFVLPIAGWFRGPLAERVRQVVTGSRLGDTGWFDMGALAKLADQHRSGLSDHSRALWSLTMFDAFLRVVHEGAVAPAPKMAVGA